MKHNSHTRAVRFLLSLFYFFSILIFTTAFDLAHNPPSGWENQFLPDLNGRIISDMCFTDSLNGYATTDNLVVRTTNGGNNWFISDSLFANLTEIEFLSKNTGFICGGNLYKTTNAGASWELVMMPPFGIAENDMDVISEDTIWITNRTGLDGGIFLTTNGGASWTRKYYGGGFSNPDRIFFVNPGLGFASMSNLLRTTDGGNTWSNLQPERGFTDIHFSDSLKGWKVTNGAIRFTSNAGINWIEQTLPPTGDTIAHNGISRISDPTKNGTIYAVGPQAFYFIPNLRGLIFKTTSFGNSWGYQLPDTSLIRFSGYDFVSFIDNYTGWTYKRITGGIFTRSGGDTTIFTGIRNISTEVPENFMLYQNYPNPFNPKTIVKFEVKSKEQTDISVYDVSGRSVAVLVSGQLQSGTYETVFDGSNLSSGIYFCVMQSGSIRQTITMALVK